MLKILKMGRKFNLIVLFLVLWNPFASVYGICSTYRLHTEENQFFTCRNEESDSINYALDSVIREVSYGKQLL